MDLLGAVGGGHALEIVPFHDARVAAALASADDVDVLAFLENLVSRQQGADFDIGRGWAVEAEFLDIALRLTVRLFKNLHAGLLEALAPFRAELRGDVAAFRANRLAAHLVLEAELDRVILVAFRRSYLQDRARTQLNDGDRGKLAARVENLRHADLQTE